MIRINLHIVDFLDIHFKLKTNSYKPHMKPNSVPVCISKNSNHPLQVLKELPKTIEKRISTISSSKEISNNSKTIHKDTLEKSGFKINCRINKIVFRIMMNNQEKNRKEKEI